MVSWWVVSRVYKFNRSVYLSSLAISLLVLCCAALVLVGTRVHLVESIRADTLLHDAATTGSQVTFQATLTGFPESKRTALGTRAWVRADVIRPSGGVPVLIWLSDSQEIPPHWGPGIAVELTARLKTQPPQDAAAYTASPIGLPTEVQPLGSLQAKIGATAALLRHSLVSNASQVPGAELVPGFAVGDTSLVSEELNGAMLESSLTHLTAVSGSNTGLVIAAVVWSVARLGAGRRFRTVAAACGLLAFVVIVGPDASVQRAAWMAAVLLIGSFGGRRSTALPALGFAVLALLATDPWQALQPGFALSVAATGGILISTPPLTRWLHTRVRLPKILALPFAIALSAQLFCGPLLLLLQPGVPAVGVIANVLAAPAAPIGTGIGLLAAALGPLSSPVATFTVSVASLPAGWVAATAEVCASLPGGRWNWPEGWPGALLLLACQLAFVAAWALRQGRVGIPGIGRIKPRSPWLPAPEAPLSIRVTAAVLISGSFAVIISTTLLNPMATYLQAPRDWVIVACDVGQGDALLVRDPLRPNDVMLVDTGDQPEALESCLTAFGVQRIALLVLTHDDRDHTGALDSVVQRVDAALISPTLLGERQDQRAVVRTLERAAVPYRVGVAGDGRSSTTSGMSWLVLAPSNTDLPTESNAASLVLLIEIDGHRLLLLADTGYEQQARLKARWQSGGALSNGAHSGDRISAAPPRAASLTELPLSNIAVLKVAHHGSRDQDTAFTESIAARWGLVTVGADNRYGHPHEDTLATLARAGTRVLRTDRYGSIALVLLPDGTLTPWVEHAPESSGRKQVSPPTSRLETWQRQQKLAKQRSPRSVMQRRALPRWC